MPENDERFADVLREKARRVFPGRPVEAVLAQLAEYGRAEGEREASRVHLAILKLCEEEGLDDPARWIAAAKRDYRDVLAWAEYPNQMRGNPTASADERRAQVRADAEQYARWRGRR